MNMNFPEIYSATGMMELIQEIGFLPLLDSGIEGFSAEDIVAEDCGYVRLPEDGWDWPPINFLENKYSPYLFSKKISIPTFLKKTSIYSILVFY